MRCSVCDKKLEYWLRREHKVYCSSCYKSALEAHEGLSTHPTEEANLRRSMEELEGQKK